MATLGGIFPHPLPTDAQGRLAEADVEGAIRPADPHLARSRLLLLENSYGARAGFPLPASYFAAMRRIATRHGLRVHLDGARLFNSAIALGCEARQLTAEVDSVTFCLSKGLCAPVGSVLCGSHAFIHEARRQRKLVGGGMRQAGVLAAAGLVALDEMTGRLAEDHALAQQLAQGLQGIPGLQLDVNQVRTNIVSFSLAEACPLDAEGFVEVLQDDHGVLLGAYGPRLLRAVTHHDVDAAAVERLLLAARKVMDLR